MEVEPFADEDDDGPAEFVDAALVEAADARHLRQVLRLGPAQQPLVPFVLLRSRRQKQNKSTNQRRFFGSRTPFVR